MKLVALVIPGLSDVPLSALGGRTPLEAAAGSGFNHLASAGRLGTAQVIPSSSPAGSVVGLPALLGYDAARLGLRRGPLEAHGMGVKLGPEDLALRLNFVSTFRGNMADTRAGHVSDREARVLLQALGRIQSEWTLRIHVGQGYRHLLVVEGGADLRLTTQSPQAALGRPLGDCGPRGKDSGPLNDFLAQASALLADHDVNRVRVDLGENPADAIWLWGEGRDVSVPALQEHLSLSACMVAAAPLVRGLAAKVGMTCPQVPGATGEVDSDLGAKCRVALEATHRHDFVMVHVASVNEASRSGDAHEKVRALTRIDRELVWPLLQWVERDRDQRLLLVTSDHQTSVDSSVGDVQPVPFAVVGRRFKGRRPRPFTETEATAADLTLPDAGSLLDLLLERRGRAADA